MPLPAFILPAVKSFVLSKGLNTLFGGGAKRNYTEQERQEFMGQDSAIRASMLSQGLAQPVAGTAGTRATNFSNVPAVQGAGGIGGIPTRQSAGLGGDAAMQLSARAYQDMLRRQMGMEISNINREFGAAGRFTSGQRLSAIQEAQQGGRQAFSDAFAKMALQKYLSGEDIASRERIAAAQLEAAGGQGRTQLTGDIMQSLALIFASNPEWLGKAYGGIKSGASAIGGFFAGGDEEYDMRNKYPEFY